MGCESVEEPVDPSQCLIALQTKLQLRLGSDPSKNKLAWQWSKGEEFLYSDLGTPLVDTKYTLCVYDMASSVATLAVAAEVAPSGSLWFDKYPSGLQYKDKSGSADGVAKLQIKAGLDAKTQVKLQAKGSNLMLPAPAGLMYFDQDPKVVAQFFNSEGACWTTEFESADNKKHDTTQFKAQTK